jgi:hypothetical protein
MKLLFDQSLRASRFTDPSLPVRRGVIGGAALDAVEPEGVSGDAERSPAPAA